jgi:hypothetical protein
MDPLVTVLRRVRRRLLAVRALEAGLAGAIVAAVPALVVTALRILLPRVLPAAPAHPAAALALLPCGFVAGFVVRLFAGASLHQAARAADRAAVLDDRMATALEVVERSKSQAASSGLDERLLADARRVAEVLDPRGLPLAATAGRRGRAALVAAVVLAALAMVPSLAGPPVDRTSAERAAGALEPLVEEESLVPAVRQAVRRAVDDLRRSGARRQDAENGTEAVYRAAAKARRGRENVTHILTSAPSEEMARMARAAAGGNAEGAEAAAGDLADRLAGASGRAPMEPAERTRLGDTLDAAVPRAREGGLPDLAEALTDAGRAVRSEEGRPAAGPALRRLAGTMVRVLGPQGEAAVAEAVDTVDRARRAMGLSAAPDMAAAGGAEDGAGGRAVGEEGPETPGVMPGDGAAGGGTSVTTVPDGVRPEDRDVVRRYFGG